MSALLLLRALLLCPLIFTVARAWAATGVTSEPQAAGLIVRYELPDKLAVAEQAALIAQRNRDLLGMASRIQAGFALNLARTTSKQVQVFRFEAPLAYSEAERLARRLAALPGVRYVVPDRIVSSQAVPLDPAFPSQWGFRYVPGSAEGGNFTAAWDLTRGDPALTVGVVDSGIARSHQEFAGQLRLSAAFPKGGYDFMSVSSLAGDGDGRDDDPEQLPNACGHGTHVAGTIAARTAFLSGDPADDGAGGAPGVKLLMARALNTSGLESDVIDAMRWLAGLEVPGLAANPHPVRVVNLSLGSAGACGGAYQDAFDDLLANGVTVIAAAGNGGGDDVANFAPANCRGAIAVAASTDTGQRASFSNLGAGITLTAPGSGILSTGGTTAGTCVKGGTSMATPHVSAAAALLLSVNPGLSPYQVRLALQAGARPFPSGSNCHTGICGAGLLDARLALDTIAATAPIRVAASDRLLSVHEGEGLASFKLSRIGNPTLPVTVTVTLLPGTAQPGLDYLNPPATVSWAAGQTADRVVSIPIQYRPGQQGDRSFTIQLAVSSGASFLGPTTIPVTIREIDCEQTFDIAIGSTVNGDLGLPGSSYCRSGVRGSNFDTVRYRFRAPRDSSLTIELTSTTPGPAVLDTYLYLLDSGFRVIAENDDIVSGVNRNSRLSEIHLPIPGTYYLEATTWSATQDKTGTYTLSLQANCRPYTEGPSCTLDVDGDGRFDAIDAQMIARAMLGLEPARLRDGLPPALACSLRPTGAAAGAFIAPQMATSPGPAAFDIDGNGSVDPLSDGLLLIRVALGLSGPAVTSGALGTGASRTDWSTIRSYLQGSCGMSGLP